MRQRRGWWGFAAATLLAFSALAFLTWKVQGAARERAEATAESQRQEDVRTALYRMEQRFAPLLARALGRTEIPGVLQGGLALELDLETGATNPVLDGRALPPALEVEALTQFESAEFPLVCVTMPSWIDTNEELGNNLRQIAARGETRSDYEYGARQNALNFSNNRPGRWIANGNPAEHVETGPLLVGWAVDGDVRRIAFARGVRDQGLAAVQGLWIDWEPLQALLLAEITDLFEESTLEPLEGDAATIPASAEQEGLRLASLPARLVPPPLDRAVDDDQALRTTFVATWALALAACVAATLAFRASQRDAARQRRFTSAVTHELRTPLTTFQMYSEMLARGMVPEERRAEYLRALEEESRRLGSLVENVLAHARLEDGRAQTRRETLTVGTLVERVAAPLRRRCEDAGTRLEVELGEAADASLHTDPDGVALILANLVDNAAKYGAPENGHSPDTPITLTATADATHVTLVVRDHGPGIPSAARSLIFRPFERAGRDESDDAPGVGLGLAIGRDLALTLGGTLTLDPSSGDPASFRLQLPRS